MCPDAHSYELTAAFCVDATRLTNALWISSWGNLLRGGERQDNISLFWPQLNHLVTYAKTFLLSQSFTTKMYSEVAAEIRFKLVCSSTVKREV